MAKRSLRITRHMKIEDTGWNREFSAMLHQLKNAYTVVGFPSDVELKGPVWPLRKNQKIAQTPEELIMIAGVHEFGSPKQNIPERSYLRAMFDKKKAKLTKDLKLAISKVIVKDTDLKTALAGVGEFAVLQVQKHIRRMKQPSLDPRTIARKHKSDLLRDSERLFESITHREVVN